MAVADFLPSRYYARAGAIAVAMLASMAALFDSRWLFLAAAAGVLSLVGMRDYVQTRHAILRNYPLLAHFRFFFEAIRPEIRQYLLEAANEAVPFSRAQRSLVYQRAKNVESRQPFGTGEDLYLTGYEWINHSLRPVEIDDFDFRVKIGGLWGSWRKPRVFVRWGAFRCGGRVATTLSRFHSGAVSPAVFSSTVISFALLPHGVKDYRHPASERGSGAFEAKSLPQQETPTAKRTFATDPRSGFAKERAQLAITASRDMAIVIDFS